MGFEIWIAECSTLQGGLWASSPGKCLEFRSSEMGFLAF